MPNLINAKAFWPTHRILYYDDGSEETVAIPPEEVASADAANALVDQKANAVADCRAELQNAIALVAASPYPTPEEQAIIDTTINSALANFRELTDPPADLTKSVADVLSWRIV